MSSIYFTVKTTKKTLFKITKLMILLNTANY